MRNIKFRAWSKSNARMLDGDVVPAPLWWRVTGKLRKSHLWLISQSDEEYKLMQYTGLKDKNGVEIYEGDIVALDMWHGNEHGYIPEEGVIKWYQPSSAFKWFSLEEDPSDGQNYWLSQADTKQREVIGNVYEHPGLLEVGDAS